MRKMQCLAPTYEVFLLKIAQTESKSLLTHEGLLVAGLAEGGGVDAGPGGEGQLAGAGGALEAGAVPHLPST